MKPWKRILLISLVVLTILSLLLSACGPTDNSNGKSDNGKNNKEKDKDKNKDKDKDKNNGNEVNADKGGNIDKITICHKTGSAKKPYVMIRISNDAAKEGHATHEGDLIPAPEDGCPATSIATDVPAK